MTDEEFMKALPAGPTFGQKMRAIFCCGDYDDEYESPRRSIQISAPTDFRRQDVQIAGLTDEQHHEIREKSRRDAQRVYHSLRPLQSSPSGTFAERPMPSMEQFTQPRGAPTPGSSPAFLNPPEFGLNPRTSPNPSPSAQRNANRVSGFYGSDNIHSIVPNGRTGALDRVKAHSRKLSDTFRKPQPSPADSGYYDHALTTDSQVEMRHLMSNSSHSNTAPKTVNSSIRDAKDSSDSFSPASEIDMGDMYQRFDSGLGSKAGNHRL